MARFPFSGSDPLLRTNAAVAALLAESLEIGCGWGKDFRVCVCSLSRVTAAATGKWHREGALSSRDECCREGYEWNTLNHAAEILRVLWMWIRVAGCFVGNAFDAGDGLFFLAEAERPDGDWGSIGFCGRGSEENHLHRSARWEGSMGD
jgi:hypothetical protein